MSDIFRYDPGDEQDIGRRVMHHAYVVNHLKEKAAELVGMAGSDNFSVVVQNNPELERPRAYARPNAKGIHEELSDHVLLKAAVSMEGR